MSKRYCPLARFEERTGMVGLLRPEVATKNSESRRWRDER